MTNEEARAYFIDNIEEIITTMKDENSYNYETQQIEPAYARRDFEAKELAIKALEQQPCEDYISLNKLDDIITKAIDESENQTECQTLRWVLDVMSELPSVTPKQKMGKWIPCTRTGLPLTEQLRRERAKWYGYKCSKCNDIYKGNALLECKYCPNCGSKMEVDGCIKVQ